MCGVAGVIGYPGSESELRAVLLDMQRGLRHRGPDDEGLFVSPGGRIGLAHTRLSILDLSPAGHQPMSTPDGRFTITFNGEIYNFLELRARLETEGASFRSRSDTEVLLKLYEKHGPEFLRSLRGMFAFAIWDEREKTCLLARGPMGIKPLYYFVKDRTLCFASEVRALLNSRMVPRRVSAAGVYGYLLDGSIPEPRTLVEGVLCLPAGHSLLWQQDRTEIKQFWNVRFHADDLDEAESTSVTRKALEDSIEHHFVSDVPVSIFLSGGLDSTALVALARNLGHPDVSTFCVSVADSSLDEAEVARKTAAHFRTRHFEPRIDGKKAKELLHEFLARMDQPTVDGFNTFCVSKEAHDNGAKVVLSGLGGDELFGGYPTFDQVPRMMRWSRALGVVGPLRAFGGRSLERTSSSPRLSRLGDFLSRTPSPTAAYRAVRGVFTPREAARLSRVYVDGSALSVDRAAVEPEPPSQPTLQDEISYLEITRYMGNQLLRDSDVMSMAWGLELRVPFVDQKLVEILSHIPAELRLAPRKRLLRMAVPELPEWVTRRPKQGFTFPFDRWITEEWGDLFAKIDAKSPVPLRTWYRRWSLFALENCLERMALTV